MIKTTFLLAKGLAKCLDCNWFYGGEIDDYSSGTKIDEMANEHCLSMGHDVEINVTMTQVISQGEEG